MKPCNLESFLFIKNISLNEKSDRFPLKGGTGVDPRLSRNVDVGAFLMARLDLLIYHCFFSKINQPTFNRRLLKVGRLIILEKSRKKKRRAGAGCGRVICHYLKAWNKLALWK